MDKHFNDIVSQSIGQFPEYQPDENCWSKIEEVLDMDAQISEKSKDLPLLEPEDRLWDNISEKLTRNPFSRRRKIASYLAAASVLAFALALSLVLRNHSIDIEEEYSVTVESSPPASADIHNLQDPTELIQQLCRTGAPICDSDDFKQKLNLYEELCEEQKGLEQIVNQIGESPEIIQSIIKIENLKSNVLQEIIQLMHS